MSTSLQEMRSTQSTELKSVDVGYESTPDVSVICGHHGRAFCIILPFVLLLVCPFYYYRYNIRNYRSDLFCNCVAGNVG